MKNIGYILLMVGAIGTYFALNMDTSVPVPGIREYRSYGISVPERVQNVGLVKDQQNYLFVSGLVMVLGVVLVVAGRNEGRKGLEKKPSQKVICDSCGTENFAATPNCTECRSPLK